MSELKKFVSVLGSAVTLVAACAPLNSMAMNEHPNHEPVFKEIKLEIEKECHVLTGEEYLKLEKISNEKGMSLYRNDDNFLIDSNMNYLDVNGKIIDGKGEKVYINPGRNKDTKVDEETYIVDYIDLHPILKYIEDQRGFNFYISCDPEDPNGNCCIVVQTKKRCLQQILIDSYGWGAIRRAEDFNLCFDKDEVFFPKKMFENYGLKDCGPEMFNKMKQKEEKYMQRLVDKERESNEVKKQEEDAQSEKENNVEQLQEANIDNGEKSSNLWKWIAGIGLAGFAEESGRRLLLNGSDNNTDESTYETEPLENNLNNDND